MLYLYSVKDLNGNTLTIDYEDGQNGGKRIKSVSDGHRALTFSYFEGTDLLKAVKDPLNRSVRFTYFDNPQTGKKQLKTFTDAEGHTTTYDYAQGAGASKLLSRIQLPKGNYIENQYDANRRLSQTVSGVNGVPTTKTSVTVAANYGNGSIGTESTVNVLRGGEESTYHYAYNANDFLTNETDAQGHKTSYGYDANDNLTSITNAKGGVTTLTYDNATDWLTSVAFAGATKRYTYNEDGTLDTFTKPDGTTLSYTYDELGRVTNDGVNSYGYDDKLRLTSMTFGSKTITYTYRKDSRLDKVDYPNGMTTQYGYDAVGRLTSKQTKLGNSTVIAGYSYTLDKVGNITEQTPQEPYDDIVLGNEDVSYTYNAGNRITKAGDLSFEFDANGNTTKRGGEAYTWDKRDRLTQAGSTAITYDPLGLIASYGDITFTTSPLGIGNVLSDSKGAEYIYGNGLEARVKNGKVGYYVTDVRGSVVAIVDDNGNVTHKYQYDEFGKVTQRQEADYNPFQYVGKYGVMVFNDHQYYMRARHYDPTIGRFLSEDPIWSTNLYPYAENNPVMWIDPRGLTSEDKARIREIEELRENIYDRIQTLGTLLHHIEEQPSNYAPSTRSEIVNYYCPLNIDFPSRTYAHEEKLG